MKKMTVFLAAGIGAAMLTGCGPGVMGDRYYKNTEGAVTTVPAGNAVEPVETAQTPVAPLPVEENIKAQEQPKSSVRTYEPMQQIESDKIIGIDESVKASSKGTKTGANRVYKVRRGDTPSGIAARHSVSLADLMQANNLTESDAKKLRVGQKLIIPAASAKKAVAGKKAVTRKKSATKNSKKAVSGKVSSAALNADGTYSVKRGDSPERIARKFKVKLSDLLNANSLDESSSRSLQIGQKLIIPGGNTVLTAPAVEQTSSSTASQDVPAVPAADNTIPAAPDAPAVSGDALAQKLENTAPAADNTTAADNSDTGNVVSHVILEKEITLVDFAAQQKTTVEELKRINSRPLPDVLHQNEIINIPFGN